MEIEKFSTTMLRKKEDDNFMTDKTPPISSHTVSCGSRTYFFDVKDAKNGNRYLKITESRFNKETNEKKRSSFILFEEDASKFFDAFEQSKSELKVS